MAINILASIGIGILSSIAKNVFSKATSSNEEEAPTPSFQDTLSSQVALSNQWKNNVRNDAPNSNETSIDSMLANAPDAVKRAWEKTKNDLGIRAGHSGYYINNTTLNTFLSQMKSNEKVNGSGIGPDISSAIDTIDAMLTRLDVQFEGYKKNARDKQAAIEMFTTFKRNLQLV